MIVCTVYIKNDSFDITLVIKMMSFVLFSALLISGAYAAPEGADSRILLGENVQIGQYPFIVSLQMKIGDNYKVFCGGSILDSTHILTTAKCIHGRSAWEIYVQYGVTELTTNANRIQVSKAVPHPHYVHGGNYPDDIAILTTSQINFGENAQPVQLTNSNTPSIPGIVVEVFGWGNTKNSGSPSSKLQRATEVVYDDLTCTNLIKTYPPYHICATGGLAGTCIGDSGGPMMYNGAQIGINSWEFNGCGNPQYPDAFIRVSYYVNWITENMR